MTKREQSVKTYSGTPPTTAFGASEGTPIVIDYTAATGYFLHPVTGIVTALGGGGGGSGITQLTGDVTAGPGSGSQVASFALGVPHHWTAVQGSTYETLTDAATITPTGSTNVSYLLCTSAVGATRTINVPTFTNGTASDYWAIEVEQPASGGPCAVVFASGFKWGKGGLDSQPLGSTTASSVDSYFFQKKHNGNWHGNQIGQAGPTGAAGTNGTNGTGYLATSATSLVTAGSGSKAFTTQTGLAYTTGARIRATSTATGDYMEGVVTSYTGGVLTATMDRNSGTGTHADWDINLAGDVGSQGPTGSTGPTGAGGFSELVNAQTGTTYTYVNNDNSKLVTHSNAAAIAGTLPQAGSGGNFAAGWWADVQNRGVGTLTITPTTSTIDGASSLALTTAQGVRLVSDGTNYFTQRGVGGGGGGGALKGFYVYLGPATQALSAATFTKVTLDTKGFDTNSWFDATTNHRFLPTIAGYYQINFGLMVDGGGTIFATIYKNGSEFKRTGGANTGTSYFATISELIFLNGSTDYLEMWVRSTSGGTVFNGENYTHFSGFLAGT